MGDSPTLGVQTNAIPRSGSNVFSGTILAKVEPSLQSNNLTSRLQATSHLSQIAPWGLTLTSSEGARPGPEAWADRS